MPATEASTSYTLAQAALDLAALRGQADRLSEILTQSDGALIPNAPPAGDYSQFATAGQMQYVSGSDGNAYDTGRQVQYVTAGVPVSSTTPAAVVTFGVGAALYRVRGILFGANGSTGTLQPQTMRLSGTASFLHVRVAVNSLRELTGQNTFAGQINDNDADPSVTLQPTLGENFRIEFDGIVQFSAPGTLIVQARNTISGADVSWTVLSYSFAEIMPVTA